MIFKNLKFKNFIYTVFLIIFSIVINQFYGYKGILPIDSFLVFNSGFDLLNGYYPFKDYWTIKEPFIDFIQAFFFKIFGVSWFSYVLHASLFNCLITLSTYSILKKFNLNQNLCLFYSFCVAILTYPTAGTPFSDHHTLILCTISFYLFILAIKEDKNIYWFLIPFILGCSAMSKQAPTAYVISLISVLTIIYIFFSKRLEGFYFAIFGFIVTISIFFILLFLGNIELQDFISQYFLYPKSLGESRLDWLLPLEFKRFVWRFKLHYLSISLLIYILIKRSFSQDRLLLSDKIILIGIISFCLIIITHQLMTINAIFIYCLIPIFSGFSHAYSLKYLNKNFISIFLIVLTIGSTFYYYVNYVNNRTFMDLRNVNFEKAIDGGLIHPKLSGIKWITMFYPEDPQKEAKRLKEAIDIVSKDTTKKMLVTDYQFISVFLNQYDFAVTRFWYDFHGYPQKNNDYFIYWKTFVLKQIKKNEIKKIYVLNPLHGEKKPLENILDQCFEKVVLTEVLYQLDLKNC